MFRVRVKHDAFECVQRQHLLTLANNSEIKLSIANEIIEQTVTVASNLSNQLQHFPIDLSLNQHICHHVAEDMAYIE